MPRDVQELATTMQRLLVDRTGMNRHAQAHARAILSQLDTPDTDWPHFSRDLDERLVFSSDLMIVHGLQLMDSEGHTDLAHQLLIRGAESLEFVTHIEHQELSVPDTLIKAAIAYHVAGHHARSYVLIQRLQQHYSNRDRFTTVVTLLLQRDLAELSRQLVTLFGTPDFQDASISTRLREGELDDDDAIAHLGRRSLAHAIALYVEYLKRGSPDLRLSQNR